MNRFVLAGLLLSAAFAVHASGSRSFDPGLSGFTVHVRDLDVTYREFALFAMPGETVSLAVPQAAAHFDVTAGAGALQRTGSNQWAWTAPAQPGHYILEVTRDDGAQERFETFVMVPATEVRDGRLNGYRIGHYPHDILHGLDSYRPPAGFVEVTPDLAGVHVSPHFTLGQFLCKEAGGFPKYLVLSPRLLLKLETLMGYLNDHGVDADSVHVMSGYRTPWYNTLLGDAPYSRHTWGDAADIYIDVAPADGVMDDLNHDGREDMKDSRLLASDADTLFHEPDYDYLRGGIGAYAATSSHGPFVHVDARGFRARW